MKILLYINFMIVKCFLFRDKLFNFQNKKFIIPNNLYNKTNHNSNFFFTNNDEYIFIIFL